MRQSIKLLLVSLLFIGFAAAQTDYKDIYVPETVTSDSFKVKNPGQGYYLHSITFLDAPELAMSPMYIKGGLTASRMDTLKYDDAGSTELYSVELPNTALQTIVLDFRRVAGFEWYQYVFSAAPSDSIRIRSIFKKFQ